jgi:AcrR family transcriptional regulator
MAGRRTDTRERIQQVALELFNERGYDGTSLREIAEVLDVTKAALYYHFRTKEDIVASLVTDVASEVSEIIEWGHAQSDPVETRAGVLRRFAALVEGSLGPVMNFIQQNVPAMKEVGAPFQFAPMMKELFELICGEDEDEETQLRARLALIALLLGTRPTLFSPPGEQPPADVALRVALDLASPRESPAATGT